MMNLLRTAPAILLAGLVLAGCAAPRSVEDDKAVRSAGVISLLNESGPIRHLGLTVFNNHAGSIGQNGKLKQVVGDTVKQRLKTSRPQWTVKSDETDANGLAEARRKPMAGGEFAEKNAAELAAIARRLDVDLLFVVTDSSRDNFPGQGVGVVFRAVGNEPDTVLAHSFVALHVIDRDGKEVVRRGAINDNPLRTSNSALGLRSDMSTLDDPKVRDTVSLLLQTHLKGAVEEAMGRAGY